MTRDIHGLSFRHLPAIALQTWRRIALSSGFGADGGDGTRGSAIAWASPHEAGGHQQSRHQQAAGLVGKGGGVDVAAGPAVSTFAEVTTLDAFDPALATPLPGGVTAAPATLTDQLDGSNDDWFKFTLSSTQTVNISGLLPAGGYPAAAPGSVSLILYDANGAVVGQGSFDANRGSTLTAMTLPAGAYYLEVQPLAGAGPYSLTYWTGAATTGTAVATDGAGSGFATAKALGTLSATPVRASDWVGTSGAKVDGADTYQFSLASRGRVGLALTGAALDGSDPITAATAIVYDGHGNQVATLDFNGNRLGQTQYLDLDAGSYYVRITPNVASTSIGYALTASSTPYAHAVGASLASAGELGSVGTAAVSASGRGDAVRGDMYRFSVGSDATISIKLSSPSATYGTADIAVYDAWGNLVKTYAGLDSFAAAVNTLQLAKGIYYVSVKETAGVAYQLSLTGDKPAGPVSVPAGGSLATADPLGAAGTTAISTTGWVGPGANVHYYSFTLDKVSRFNPLLTSPTGSPAPALAVYDANGVALGLPSVLAAGTYYIAVSEPNDGLVSQSSYGLSLTATGLDGAAGHDFAAATAIAPTTTVKVVSDWVGLDKGSDVYRFSLSAADTLNLQFALTERLPAGGDVSYRIVRDDGTQITAGKTFNGTVGIPLAAGTYFIEIDAETAGQADSANYSLVYWTGPVAVGSPAKDLAGNTRAAAADLGTLSTQVVRRTDSVGPYDGDDYYKFTLGQASRVSFTFAGVTNLGALSARLYLSDGTAVGGISYPLDLNGIDLPAGTYYVDISGGSVETPYQMLAVAAPITTAGGTSAQPKALGQLRATPVSVTGEAYSYATAAGAAKSTKDYYSFSVATVSTVSLKIGDLWVAGGSVTDAAWTLQITDSTGWVAYSTSGSDARTISVVLAPGSYRVIVGASDPTSASGYNPIAVNYTLTASTSASPNGPAGMTLATATVLPAFTATPTVVAQDWVGRGATKDFYRFTLAEPGTLTLEFSPTYSSGIRLMDADGNEVSSGQFDSLHPIMMTNTLAAGTYYLSVENTIDASYKISASLTAFPDGPAGHSLDAATVLTVGPSRQTVSDWIGRGATDDYYQVTLPSAAYVNFAIKLNGDPTLTVDLLDSNGNRIKGVDFYSIANVTSLVADLQPGVYYVRVYDNANGANGTYDLTYWTGRPATGSYDAPDGAGNTVALARNLGTIGTTPATVTDWVGSQDPSDFYKFTLTGSSIVSFTAAGGSAQNPSSSLLTLYDASGNTLSTLSGAWLSGNETVTKVQLAAGTYYASFSTNSADVGYSLSIAAEPRPPGAGTTLATARELGANPAVYGITDLVSNALTEYVHFSLTVPTVIDLTLVTPANEVGATLLDANGNVIAGSKVSGSSERPGRLHSQLAAGDYYIAIVGGGSSLQTYSFTLAPAGAVAPPTASIADVQVLEGNSGTTNLVFTVALSAASATATTFAYATSNGTATAGSDYTAASGTLTIAAGATTGTIVVAVKGDAAYEPDETVKLTLSNPSGAIFAGGATSLAATGTIRNDDGPVASIADVAVVEGNSGTTNMVFTVTLSGPSATATSFSYVTANGSATAISDYTPVSGTLTIAAGATSGTITVPITGDTVYEADETIKLTLSNPSGASLSGGGTSLTATGTITNDDTAPVASVADVSILEGNSGTVNLVFTVTLSVASTTATSFSYATANGTAAAGSDYAAQSGTLTIAAGAMTGTITIPVTGDTLYEADETVKLTLTNPSGASFAGGAASLTATGTIRNEDLPPIATISTPTVVEGNSGTSNLVFTVTLSTASGRPATIVYETFNGSATAGSDYTAVSGTLTIAAGATTGTIVVPVIGDTVYEGNETLGIRLSSPNGVNFAGGAATISTAGTITNDDAMPVATIAAASVAEGNSGTTSLVFTVTLSSASSTATTFSYATANGSALAGSDYTAASGTLTIAAGATSGTITVPVSGDTVYEPDETLSLTLSNASGATFAGGAATATASGTIVNDDAKPVASIADVTVVEGNSGTTSLVFTVSLSAASTVATTIAYATSNGTATAGSDYTAASGILTIAAGATSGTITVAVAGDAVQEANETLKLTLSNPTGASFAGGAATLTATGTIKDDDTKPTISIGNASVLEGNSGTTNLVFTVTLSAASTTATTIAYATSNGTATAGSDYTAKSGTLTIAAGATSGTITVSVAGDTATEADETLSLTLSNASGASFAGGASSLTATGTIRNDDGAHLISVADVTVLEGNSGTASLVFTVTLSQPSASAVTVAYATSNGSATAGSDYTAASGTLTIAAGATTGTITIPVTGDTLYEADETVKLTLTNPSGATFASGAASLTATGTIRNEDLPPIATLSSPSVVEGNSGTASLVFTVTLSAASALPATIAFESFNGTATGGSDFTPVSGTLTIAAGAKTGTITVPITGDTVYEADETLGIRLYNANGVNFAGGVASISSAGVITNDDTKPVISMVGGSAVEGNSGTANLVFTVNLSAASGLPTTVSYATSNVNSQAGVDYIATSGTLTIAAGATSGTITVPVIGDTSYDGDRLVRVTLTNPTGATLPGNGVEITADGTIKDDDGMPAAFISPTGTVKETNASQDVGFWVSLTNPSASPVTFTYQTFDGTAVAGYDYVAASGTVTVQPGQTSTGIIITMLGDTTYEGDETFGVRFSNPIGATIQGGGTSLSSIATIQNDDPAPVLSIADVAVAEGNSGTTKLIFTVQLSAASGLPTTVAYATANGTATAGSDYTAASGTLTIAAGNTTGTITVSVAGDAIKEADETLKLTLTSPSGASFAGGATSLTATGTIRNDDGAPIASIADVAVTEGNSGTTNLVFTVTLSAASTTATTFSYATANGTATAGSDYAAASGTLTIAAGATTGTITIPVTGDTTYEPDETVKLTLSNPSGATFTGGAASLTATGTIKNDDAAPVASIADVSVAEGNSGTTNLVFTVKLSAASGTATTITYATANGTATAGSDYTAASGTLTIAAGATTGTITVAVAGDTAAEGNETLKLTLANPSGASFAGGVTSLTATGTISNDDFTAPKLTVAPVTFQIVDGLPSQVPAPPAPVALSSLVSGSVAVNDAIQSYQIIDTDADAGSASISINGVRQAASATITLTPAQFAQTVINPGTVAASDSIMVRAIGQGGTGSWESILATTRVSGMAQLSATDRTVTAKSSTALSALVSVLSTVPVSVYEFLDMTPDAASGSLKVGGTTQAAFSVVDVMASQLSTSSFTAGAAGSSDEIWVRGWNGTNWSNWSSFKISSAAIAGA